MNENGAHVKYILIVDDLESQRRAMKVLIRQAVPRSEFIMASTSLEATEKIRARTDPIDLAIIDLKLEKDQEEGIELIRTLKSTCHRREAKILLITAYPDRTIWDLARGAGADVCISKLDDSVSTELQQAAVRLLQ